MEQVEFVFDDVSGTLVGFRCPEYVKGINVAGYHLLFISEDRGAGGHVLEVRTGDVTVEIDKTAHFFMSLPDDREFYAADLSRESYVE